MNRLSWTANCLVLTAVVLPLCAFGYPGPMELILIFGALLLLFGAKRIPEIARSLGSGIQEFKKSVSAIEEDKSSTQSQLNDTDSSEK